MEEPSPSTDQERPNTSPPDGARSRRPRGRREITALTAAVVLTLTAFVTAVAVNLDHPDQRPGPDAGRLNVLDAAEQVPEPVATLADGSPATAPNATAATEPRAVTDPAAASDRHDHDHVNDDDHHRDDHSEDGHHGADDDD